MTRTSFLTEMATASAERARESASRIPLRELQREALLVPPASLELSDAGFDLVAEVKFTSPAVGRLISDQPTKPRLRERVSAYAEAGACAISVLTEPSRFEGSLDDLHVAARHAARPVLRKDFLVDPYQVWEARAHGASGVLLIARLVATTPLATLIEEAEQAGLFVLLEAFDERDLDRIADVRARTSHPELLVGVNGRNLTTLEVEPDRHLALAGRLPDGVPCVAESGLVSAEDAARAASAGYRLGLVGTALMRSSNPAALARSMISAGRHARPVPIDDMLAANRREKGRSLR